MPLPYPIIETLHAAHAASAQLVLQEVFDHSAFRRLQAVAVGYITVAKIAARTSNLLTRCGAG